MPVALSLRDCRRFPSDSRLGYPPVDGAPLAGCSVTGDPGAGPGQQVQAHGGQVCPAVQAGQAQPHPPVPEPLPPSDVTTGVIRAQLPVGHGVVMHSIVREVQPQSSAVSAVQEAASVCAVQGSAGSLPQPQGAQAVFAGQAGQPHTDADPPPVLSVGVVLELDGVAVMVVVEPFVQEQLQAAQASPAGQTGQLQVQVPGLPPAPVAPPDPVAPPVPAPQPPPAPPAPPPVPHWQSHGGQASPGRHAGQPQVQVPPPPLPASTGCGDGQSHCTGGQAPFAGQASGWTHRQVVPPAEESR